MKAGQAKAQLDAKFDAQLRHRIDVGRAVVRDQVAFFGQQFGQVSSEWKADDTRVTLADFAISRNIFAALRCAFPEDDFCSEEANPHDEMIKLEARFAWVLDPIDGTNNYALGCPFCAISLALLVEGEPVYGFIYDHSTEDLLEGGVGYGLQRNQRKIDREATAADAQTMVGLHFPMSRGQMAALAGLLEQYRVRCIGSGALTAAYVATGYLAGVVDYRVKVWDIAAAYALCQAAGLRWQFTDGSPFPLKNFHPQMDFSPYYAGSQSFIEQLHQC